MKKIYTLPFVFLCNILLAQQITFEEVVAPNTLVPMWDEFGPAHTGDIAKADIDSDGDIDVFISGVGGNSFYINNGTGRFDRTYDYNIDWVKNSMISFADIDNDGDQDLFTSGINNQGQVIVRIYENNGNGFFNSTNYGATVIPVYDGDAQLADFDGDNLSDLVISGKNSTGNAVSKIYLNDGIGSFVENTFTVLDQVKNSALDVADFDNDGDQDIVICGELDNGNSSSQLYENDGHGNFSSYSGITMSPINRCDVKFANLNGSSELDIICTGITDQGLRYISLYTQDQNNNFNSSVVTGNGVAYGSITTSDIDLDGDVDFFITGENNALQRTSKLYINNGNGYFTEDQNNTFVGAKYASTIFIDANSDGFDDLIHMGLTDSDVITNYYCNHPYSNQFYIPQKYPIEYVEYSSLEFEDVDSDGDADLMVTGYSHVFEEYSQLYKNDGNGFLSPDFSNSFPGIAYSKIKYADIDNDGDKDLFLMGRNSSNILISDLYLNDGNGNFTLDLSNVGSIFPLVNSDAVFADINNDTYLDLIICGADGLSHNDSIYTKVYINDGTGALSEIFNHGLNPVREGSIDYSDVDSDGDFDIFLTGESYNFQSKLTELYLNDGTGSFSLDTNNTFQNVKRSTVIFGDSDGDGDEDIFLMGYNNDPFDFCIRLYKNDGNGLFSEVNNNFPMHDLYFGDILLEDFDNDTDLDIIITGASWGSVYGLIDANSFLFENDGNGLYTEIQQNQIPKLAFGCLASADIDQDGDLDFVISGGSGRTHLFKNITGQLSISESQPSKNKLFKIFPNPNKGLFTVSIENENIEELKIFDLNGKLVFQKKSNASSIQIQQNLNPGMYIIQCYSKGQFYSEKMIIK